MRYLIWLVPILAAVMPVSAQESAPEYRHLITIPRESFLIQYQPEYFAFNPDGTQIAAAATAEMVNVWDVETGAVIHQLEHDGLSVSWSPDGTRIATGGSSWSMRMWDAFSGELLYELEEGSGWYIGWASDSGSFVTNGHRVFDAASGDLLIKLDMNWGVAYEAKWSPDNSMIAIASGWEGRDTQIWSAEGEHLDSFLTGTSISWSPDSTRLASIGQVRDVSTGLPVTIIPEMGGRIAWHPTEEWIASAYEGWVHLWNAQSGDKIASWEQPGCDILGFAWSSDGDRFAVDCLGDMSQPNFRNELIIWERVQ